MWSHRRTIKGICLKGLKKQKFQPKIVGVLNDIQVGPLPYKNPKL
jgi:hypothetical protein